MWPFDSAPPKVIHTNERQKCWEARDGFFQCLDKNRIVSGTDPRAKSACGESQSKFNDNCIKMWVDYFLQKRIADVQKAARIQQLEQAGYKPLDSPITVEEVPDNRQ
ncbi:Coa6 protein [Starmerella bacillaris]|uniref:Coa6 protein n=1 Tax=Starmerella bacillaris TaxID=1247836 RepID=A0AAV5RFI5_STABA|nr:Coa6 protein [Starmerella bacillaris]